MFSVLMFKFHGLGLMVQVSGFAVRSTYLNLGGTFSNSILPIS